MARWKNRPQDSNWGEFGSDDQLGRMNLLTAQRRLRAVHEVREGIVFALSLPLDYPGGSSLVPMRKPPRLFAEPAGSQSFYNFRFAQVSPGSRDTCCDDAVVLYTQYSTQWDSLAHFGACFDADGDGEAEIVYYNGYRAGEHVVGPEAGGPRAQALGIEQLAASGVQGRGVLVNLYAIYGDAPVAVGYDALMRAMEAQGAAVEAGDFLLLWTGFDDLLLGMHRAPDVERLQRSSAGLDGDDQRLLRWIGESGLVAICSDNIAVEAAGRGPEEFAAHTHAARGASHTMLPLHEYCLFKQGIHLGELWLLRDLARWLAAHRRSSFLLTAPPLRLPGSVGSPVTPVATV